MKKISRPMPVLAAIFLIALSTAFATVQTNSVANTNSAALTTEKQPLPKLLDLGANKCVPCKAMMPVLEELKKEHAGKLDVEFIDVWKNPDEGKKYKIEIIPTQIFLDANGQELFRHVGFFSKDDILAEWKELGVSLKD